MFNWLATASLPRTRDEFATDDHGRSANKVGKLEKSGASFEWAPALKASSRSISKNYLPIIKLDHGARKDNDSHNKSNDSAIAGYDPQ